MSWIINRRSFLAQSAAAGALTACSDMSGNARPEDGAGLALADGRRVTGAVRRDETIRRYDGEGDNWYMTWASDDRQLAALCDGYGFTDPPVEMYNSRLIAVTGHPRDATFADVPTYPDKLLSDPVPASFYGFGTLAVGDHLYQYMSTFADSTLPKDVAPTFCFNGVKLIHSPDNGATWYNQDGTTPVRWQTKEERSRETLVFWQEPQDTFGMISVLQMGKAYEQNQDGYIYVYAPNGSVEGTLNQLAMFRVLKDRILDRGAYEYFVARRDDGTAEWSTDIAKRGAVHTFPTGWSNKTTHPMSWSPSLAYNAPLDLYMMANWGMGTSAEGDWFAKPSYLGLWVAKTPWGPWTQILEEQAWTPGKDAKARAYSPVIAPKWISDDGKSFWLVWTDFQHTAEFDQALGNALGILTKDHAESMRLMALAHKERPWYTFNVQRVDLEVV